MDREEHENPAGQFQAARLAAEAFRLPAPVEAVRRHGSGHIHGTYRIQTACGDFLLQRLNEHVFPDLQILMQNIRLVEAHLEGLQAHHPDPGRRRLRLVPCHTGGGEVLHRCPARQAWRMFHFISGALSYDQPPSLGHVRRAARAYGEFQRHLDSLPGPALGSPLPGFHDTARRFAALNEALADNRAGRREEGGRAFTLISHHRPLIHEFAGCSLPVRAVHNDTKLNNILFDAGTQDALCVVDWDTIMPGYAAHDFGDMVRSTATEAAEDEPDASQAHINPALFAAIAHGYLEATRGWLTRAEITSLFNGARVILLEQAIRFLTDFLNGDLYYPVTHRRHNLDRCHVQLALLMSLESQEPALRPLLRG